MREHDRLRIFGQRGGGQELGAVVGITVAQATPLVGVLGRRQPAAHAGYPSGGTSSTHCSLSFSASKPSRNRTTSTVPSTSRISPARVMSRTYLWSISIIWDRPR